MLRRLRFIPREERFFDLFNHSAGCVLEAAEALLDLVQNYVEVEHKAQRIKEIEHTGDEINHQIFRALNRTFVTPLDREDISHLALALDDVLDWTEEVARRLRIYRIDQPTEVAKTFVSLLTDQARAIQRAVAQLDNLKERNDIQQLLIEIHRLENAADDLAAEALGGLYDGVQDVPTLIQRIRWSELYELMEEATDRADHVAVALQNIAIKNT